MELFIPGTMETRCLKYSGMAGWFWGGFYGSDSKCQDLSSSDAYILRVCHSLVAGMLMNTNFTILCMSLQGKSMKSIKTGYTWKGSHHCTAFSSSTSHPHG